MKKNKMSTPKCFVLKGLAPLDRPSDSEHGVDLKIVLVVLVVLVVVLVVLGVVF